MPPANAPPGRSATSADRNLLLGVLALQMNFINREQLIAAVNEWVLDKSQLLDVILVRHKALQADTKELLSALVQKHLDLHDNDPEKSLAAVSAVAAAAMPQELVQVPDDDVQASLQHFSVMGAGSMNGGGEAVNRYVTQTPSVGASTSTGSRFRILRPHAKGGLGEVLVAHDEELQREVALKQIQDRHADNLDSRARFILEAEITGGLEHPGIVPVYGFGTYGDGRPYYAMRFIQGDSLKDAIERYHRPTKGREGPVPTTADRNMERRALLRRFVDVCNAIDYAHSRGVLHRDLKPGNIMLGKYGETLVVDWGLAKSVGKAETISPSLERAITPSGGASGTVMGSAMGTPPFMSPEQAGGRLDELGPPSDVYSLGATLYCVLTGRPPFEGGDVGAILQKVQKGDFPHPRELNREVPRALQAICLKAMALAPQDRYPTPREMAEDIEDWLADEPVSAAPDTLSQRIARFTRRHRKGMQAAALAVVAIVGILAWAWYVNVKALAESETSLRRALAMVDELFTRVSEDDLRDMPGMQTVRKDMLERALKHYEWFLEQRAGDQAIRDELAAAEYRIGQITEEIGSADTALDSYERAREAQEALLQEHPDDAVRVKALSDTLNAQGTLLFKTGEVEKAIEVFQQAITLRTQAAELNPDDVEAQRLLANTIMNLGLIEFRSERLAEAKRYYEQAQKLRAKLVAKTDNPKVRRDLAMGYYNLAGLAQVNQDIPAAERHLGLAISGFEGLLKDEPHVLANQYRLAVCYRTLADVKSSQGDVRKALDLYRSALPQMVTLAKANPAVARFQEELSSLYMNVGGLQSELGEAAAIESFRLALEIQETLVQQYPEEPNYRRDWTVTLREMARLEEAAGDHAAARAHLQSAQQGFTKLLTEFPDDPDFQAGLTEANEALSKAPAGESSAGQ